MKGSNAQPGPLKEQGLSEYQRRASWLRISPSPHWRQGGRWAAARASRQGAILAPEMASSTKLWAGSQLLTMSSWDPGRLTSARSVTGWHQLPRGDTRHTWDGTLMAHLGNSAAGSGEVIKMHGQPGRVRLPSTWSPELLGPRKGTKRRPNRVCALAEYLRTWTWVA